MEARLPLSDEKYLSSLGEKVAEAVNGKFQSYVNSIWSSSHVTEAFSFLTSVDVLFFEPKFRTMPIPEVLFEEVRTCAKKWRTISERMCNDVADAGKCLPMNETLFECALDSDL